MYDLCETEKKILIDIIKRIPGYNTHMIDKNGSDLFVGDKVKVYNFNDENYVTGLVQYDEELFEFYIVFDKKILYNDEWNTNYFYFIKLEDNGRIIPYIERNRIEKITQEGINYINELDKKYYISLIENKKYKEFYNEIDELQKDHKLKLSKLEISLFYKIFKNTEKKIDIEYITIKTVGKFLDKINIYEFIEHNIVNIKNRILKEIDNTNDRLFYAGSFIINKIKINYEYSIDNSGYGLIITLNYVN